jgi:hypothetical protein
MGDRLAELHADPYAGLEESDPELTRRIDLAMQAIAPPLPPTDNFGMPLREALRANIVECDIMIEQRKAILLTDGDRKGIEIKRQLLRRVLREFGHVDPRLRYEWGLISPDDPHVDFLAAVKTAIPRMKRTLDDYDKRLRVTRRPKTIDDQECARAALNFLRYHLGRTIERGGKEYIRLTLAFAGRVDGAKRVTKMRTACGEVYDQELAAAKPTAKAGTNRRKKTIKPSRKAAG